MTDELNQQVRDALQRRQRSRVVPIALIMCAVAGSALAYRHGARRIDQVGQQEHQGQHQHRRMGLPL